MYIDGCSTAVRGSSITHSCTLAHLFCTMFASTIAWLTLYSPCENALNAIMEQADHFAVAEETTTLKSRLLQLLAESENITDPQQKLTMYRAQVNALEAVRDSMNAGPVSTTQDNNNHNNHGKAANDEARVNFRTSDHPEREPATTTPDRSQSVQRSPTPTLYGGYEYHHHILLRPPQYSQECEFWDCDRSICECTHQDQMELYPILISSLPERPADGTRRGGEGRWPRTRR
ncbi:unnamed protein product [Periconia digitata]|uniref:Uncharacterized protein n=1 Tax=Periconia digitata TaxID=1303443 RepID=A0A9W4UQG8_9PLEO|nr:unnamed protein product [Periconia digitata]